MADDSAAAVPCARARNRRQSQIQRPACAAGAGWPTEPILIAGKRSSAVLISEEDWKAIQETMHLLSIPGMRKSIRDAMAEPLAKSAKEINW